MLYRVSWSTTDEINILELTYNTVFTSPEVVNDTPFREDVTNAPIFREKLCCIALDEVHLVDEWKDFRNEYARIGWFRQALPRHIPLFAASATLGPIVRERVRRSCNFRESFCLIETSIDRDEIFIGVYTMDHARNSFLDLSGIRTQDFFVWSLDAVSQHRRSAQALIGLGTGRSPSSSGCSPSAQALLSRAQSCSSTLSSEPIMHFLTRPSCRGPLVKFRRRFSGCPVPGT